jgi:enoyl-CoA hydratase
MADSRKVRYEIENEIAVVTIDSPPFNTYTLEMMADFETSFRELHEAALRATVVTGIGNVFQGGADINIFLQAKTSQDGYNFVQRVQEMLNLVVDLECPVIAAINGLALGGGTELALACDIRIASKSATFGLPEVKFGIIPGAGGTQRAPRLLGPGRAKALIFAGGIIDADEAFRIGLVDRIVPPGKLMEEAMNLADKIATRSPAAVRAAKKAINEGLDVSLSDGLIIERNYLAQLAEDGEMAEGATAFLQKRKPVFTK